MAIQKHTVGHTPRADGGFSMKQPPLTQAPRKWLEAIVNDTDDDVNDAVFDIQIQSGVDGKDYVFTYLLGDIRDELRRRDAN